MAKEITSPFSPGQPVDVELFVGRTDQLGRLKQKIDGARSGRLQIAFLTGERGIGKTSLAAYMRTYAQNVNQMMGLHIMLGGVTSVETVVYRIFDTLLKDSVDRPWYEVVTEFLGKHVKKVGLFGVTVELAIAPEDLRNATHSFARALTRLIEKLRPEKQGLLLILDDINGIAASADFANWLKSLVDEIATMGVSAPLCLLLVGLEDRRQQMIALQPSLSRVFDLVHIPELSTHEVHDFYQKAFATVGMDIDERALSMLSAHAGGLPVLAHELGDAAFNTDTDNKVDYEDAITAVLRAAEVVGGKYIEPQIISAISSEHYRSILCKLAMASNPMGEFTRKEALNLLSEEEGKVFDNFLSRMRKMGVIVSADSRGKYVFPNALHRLYFRMYASRRGTTSTASSDEGMETCP